MRILYVTQVPLDVPSGASRHVLSVTRELARLGHEVALLAPGEAEVPGVRRVRAGRLRPGIRLELAHAALVAREAVRRRPDVALLRLSASTSAVASALSFARIPFAAELNGPILDELSRLGRPPGMIEASRLALGTVLRLARRLVVTQPSFGAHAERHLGAVDWEFLPNGADLELATPGDRTEARQRLGLPLEARIAAHVGNLAAELRLDLLAEAHRRMPGVALLFVGDGPQRPFVDAMSLTTRPSSPVLYLGRRPHAEAVDAIRAADVCLDARDENVGSKSLEYAALGRRQVVFAGDGAERLLRLYPRELRAVHLVGERSAGALRDGISAALEAERSLGPLPAEAIETARAELGWDANASRLAELLAAVAAS